MTSPIPAGSAQETDRAVVIARAAALSRDAAARWLTTDTVTAVGQQMAGAVTRHRRITGRQPTWAEALAGVDPALLGPMTTAPTDWPLPAAAWRRELRGRLMVQLKYNRWVTYTTAPRSLRVATRGQAWLTGRETTVPVTPPTAALAIAPSHRRWSTARPEPE